MKSRFLAKVAWYFGSCLPLFAEAHCFCKVAHDQGTTVTKVDNPVMDFGQIATYTGFNQQGSANQKDCSKKCDISVANWKADKAALCLGFGQANGAVLKSYNAVGTNDYGWGETIPPSLVNFPNGCAPSVLGAIYPKYQILTVLYAPPGCAGTACADQGEVDYQTGASSGTKVSTDKSFKYGASVDATLGLPGIAAFTASGGFGVTQTDSSSETISKQQTNDVRLPSTKDGVDHDQDVFILLMNPALMVKTQGQATWWNMGYKGAAAAIAQVTVADLKSCAFSPQSPFSKLNSSDCNVILQQDPFSNGSAVIDSKRFSQTNSTYSYLPSTSCGVFSDSIQHERDTDSSHSNSSEYTVGASQDMGVEGTLNVKATEQFTWTNSSSNTATTGATQSATFKLPCPGSDTGKPWIEVYWDSLYGTFMFMPRLQSEMGLKVHYGQVSIPPRSSTPRQHVKLSYGGKSYQTSTNAIGEYQFFMPRGVAGSRLPTTGQLSVGGIEQVVPLSTQNTPAACPNLNLSYQSRANSSVVNASLALTNKGPTRAGDVKVTAIACNSGFVYSPQNGLLATPFAVPGASAMGPNATTGFNVFFTRPGGALNAGFSCTINWTERSGCQGTSVLNIP